MKTPSSSAQDRQVSVWFHKIENGEIKLPRFQRHQAWDKNRIKSLLDTVTSNLPLGVTLLLNVDKEQFVSRHLVTAPKIDGRVTEHLLDGQQRLTSLWRALHNNYEECTYFLYLQEYDQYLDDDENKGEIFVWVQNRWVHKNGNTMPLWADTAKGSFERGCIPMQLLRPGDISKELDVWVDKAFADSKPNSSVDGYEKILEQWMETKAALKNTIRDYREIIAHFNLPYLALPAQTTKETALQVFINMNTNSKPLSQYDIIRAEIEGVKGVSLDDYQQELADKHPNIGYYSELPFLILATSALMQKKSPNQKGMWDMAKDEMVERWPEMESGLKGMAEFLESQAIYDKQRLPTNAVLAVIAALYTVIPRNLDARGKCEILLKKYLWSSFFTDRYENAAATHAFADYSALRKVIQGKKKKDGSLWTEHDVPVLNTESNPLATAEELARVGWPKRENIRARAIMAVFSKLGAHDFADGSQLTRQQLLEGRRQYHHIFPQALLKQHDTDPNLALNCALITDKTNLNISNKDPLEYLKDRYDWTTEDVVNTRLKSHLIPITELKSGGYADFNDEQRAEKLGNDFQGFVAQRAEYVVSAMQQLTAGQDISANDVINASSADK